MRTVATTLCALVLVFAARPASAVLVTYSFTSTMTGSLDGVDFTDEAFTLTVLADTENIGTFSDGYFVSTELSTFTFPSLAGGTTVDVTTTNTSLFVNNSGSVLGFSNDDYFTDLLFLENSAFATYDLTTPIGPLSEDSFAVISEFGTPIQTTGGELLAIDDFDASITFSAIPEPSSFLAFGLVTAGLTGASRRRSQRTDD